MTGDQARTASTIAALVVTLWVLVVLSRPIRVWKAALIAAMVTLALAAITIPFVRDFFQFDVPTSILPHALAVGAVGAFVVEVVARWSHRHNGDAPEPPPAPVR